MLYGCVDCVLCGCVDCVPCGCVDCMGAKRDLTECYYDI
jgi:hypothetical protein